MTEHTYEVRVTGLLPTTEVLDELGEVELAGHDVSTVLSGRFDDQAALSAFLRRLRAHGLEVLEIRRVLDGDDDEPEQAPTGTSSGPGDD